MCLGSWHMIAKRSLKCVSSAKSTSKLDSILMKLNYLRVKDFFIITPLVWNWPSNLFLLHVCIYAHVIMYQSSLSKDIFENTVINICFYQVWINVGIWLTCRYHFHFQFSFITPYLNFSIHFKQSTMWFLIAIHQGPLTDSLACKVYDL